MATPSHGDPHLAPTDASPNCGFPQQSSTASCDPQATPAFQAGRHPRQQQCLDTVWVLLESQPGESLHTAGSCDLQQAWQSPSVISNFTHWTQGAGGARQGWYWATRPGVPELNQEPGTQETRVQGQITLDFHFQPQGTWLSVVFTVDSLTPQELNCSPFQEGGRELRVPAPLFRGHPPCGG